MRCADCRGLITPLRTSTTGYRHVPGLPPCEVHPPRPLEDSPSDCGERGSAEAAGTLSGPRTDAPHRPRPGGPVLLQ